MPGLGRPPTPERVKFTSRAAVLAVVICAIALSLAYPVREYIAQRRQIDQLQAERQQLTGQLRQLQQHQQRLGDPAYVEQLARNELHLCMRGDTCYVVISNHPKHVAGKTDVASLTPCYERMWQSVQEANRGSAK
jgi:cell division protein FtsL